MTGTLAKLQREGSDDGTITAIASTPAPDRYGDVVAPSWDLAAFKANPVIMHGHDYEGPVVGKAVEIDLVGDTLMMRVKFDESETSSHYESEAATPARRRKGSTRSSPSIGDALTPLLGFAQPMRS